MLQNPIHLRLERLESWQHVTLWPAYANACTPITPYSVSKLVLVMGRFTAAFSISSGKR